MRKALWLTGKIVYPYREQLVAQLQEQIQLLEEDGDQLREQVSGNGDPSLLMTLLMIKIYVLTAIYMCLYPA